MKIFIRPESEYFHPIRYVMKLIEKQCALQIRFVDLKEDAEVLFDYDDEQSQPIATAFYTNVVSAERNLNHTHVFKNKPVIETDNDEVDHIATIFYLVNCLQEWTQTKNDQDQYGRFKYEHSLQHRFDLIEQNAVLNHMTAWLEQFNMKPGLKPSVFFISHDIDSLYGSLLQDNFWALKRLRIDIIIKLLCLEVIRKPHWRNIDRVMSVTSEFDIRSTFFWLVNSGQGDSGAKNADYSIQKEKSWLNTIENNGFINGLHKSCSSMSINDELQKIGAKTTYNRYHYLKFSLPEDWKRISDSNVTFDASLGFAEHYGFRNSYGHAFQPFDIDKMKPFDFVEAPLTFMDGTLHQYMGIEKSEIASKVIDFYEHHESGCTLSLLWHNTHFTQYKYAGFLDIYKHILGYIYEKKIEAVTPDDIIKDAQLTW